DGLYAVRRAAYRGLSRQAPDALQMACDAWARSPILHLRQRAAEMCGWLSGDAFPEFFAILRSDPELLVRKAAERAHSERRERSWARAYLARVREVRGTTIEEMVAAWRYGQALIAVGDDEC